YGMGVRSYLLGRPPVTNMYETVVWVPWGAIIFAALLEWKSRSRTVLMVSALLSVFCLILTDLAPSVLDKSLSPLQPVLRDNFWLTTHVLVITLSYAAFFLAFALADLQLFYFLRDENKFAQKIQEGTKAIYRSIQVGVILLGAGIILGGIWADYSWGRFWGWDPKENGALLICLWLLVAIHGRLAGKMKALGYALAMCFTNIIVALAWFGVNLLNVGLHSYGFTENIAYNLAAFCILQMVVIIGAWVTILFRESKNGVKTA
ncbi:MAG: cytochrome c biogenesis protein CcsA, partial [Bdellovibrionales bacterium]|nr:cytochrome c biogenesis protein CcsA [Bdellovibrionales bacterium]